VSALLARLTRQLAAKGVKGAANMASGLLKKRGQMSDSGKLTSKGKMRQSMGAEGRAKSRAVKYGGGKTSDYKYNPKTNRTRKK
jgi:hypothetical protein